MDPYVIEVHQSIQNLRNEYGNSESIQQLFKQCVYFRIDYDSYSGWKEIQGDDSIHIYLGLNDNQIVAYFVNAKYDNGSMIEEMTSDHILMVQSYHEIDDEDVDLRSFILAENGNMAYVDIAAESFRWMLARKSWVQSQIEKVPTNEILKGFKLADNAVMATFGEGAQHADTVYMLPGLFLDEDTQDKIGISMVFWASYFDGEQNLLSTLNNLTHGCPPNCKNQIYYLSSPEIYVSI